MAGEGGMLSEGCPQWGTRKRPSGAALRETCWLGDFEERIDNIKKNDM